MRHAFLGTLEFGIRQLRRGVRVLGMLALGATRRGELERAIAQGWRCGALEGGVMPPVLAGWEAAFYDAHLQPRSRLLLVGCGAGRDLIALLERGHRADGIDVERDAVALCRIELGKRGLQAALYDTPLADTRFEAAYDAVVFSWFVYGYIPGAPARVAALARLRDALRPGGRVLLSYQLRPASSRVPAWLARLAARATRSDWLPEHGDSVELLGGGERALAFEHRFVGDEVVEEARAAGFRVLWHEQARDGQVVLLRD